MSEDECMTLAGKLFKELVHGTPSPRDGAEVVLYLHAMVWMGQDNPGDVEGMLESYVDALRHTITHGKMVSVQ